MGVSIILEKGPRLISNNTMDKKAAIRPINIDSYIKWPNSCLFWAPKTMRMPISLIRISLLAVRRLMKFERVIRSINIAREDKMIRSFISPGLPRVIEKAVDLRWISLNFWSPDSGKKPDLP